jgi:[glutamine synthetase] adenylyltransferase / [glutamine synthetase]-adenylyl-L-tyrosine phosphorylase
MEKSTALVRTLDSALSGNRQTSLSELVLGLDFFEAEKTTTNLELLHEALQDIPLLASLVDTALTTADPDLALNNLERLLGTIDTARLKSVLLVEKSRLLLLTTLGASPFLSGILCRRAVFFDDLFTEGEIRRSKDEATMLAELRRRIPDGTDFAELQKQLRLYKSREILRIGCRDLGGLADLVEVTAELTALAVASLQLAYEISLVQLRAEYGAPLLDGEAGAPVTEAEFTIFGMGKLGGCELNFSSDIDLIYFYSSERGMTAGIPGPTGKTKNSIHLHPFFCKLSDLISKAISQPTEDGFVFRVDLRLRPEGNNGEMANSLRSAEVYYESWGQSWERAALIKARPVAGSIAIGEKLLENLEPFIFRRYLDYGMVADIKGMKQKIDQSLARRQEAETNLKLGRGGIREIEFFIQALQLIHSGKKPTLREKNSLRALARLQHEGLISPEVRQVLHNAYVFLRTVEHRIQVVQERQTHNLPTAETEYKTLARRCDFADTDAFNAALEQHRSGVESIYRELFYNSEEEVGEAVRPEVAFLFDPAADVDLIKDLLEEKGFKNPDTAHETLLMLRDGPPHSHLTRRSRRQLDRIAPLLMQEVLDSPEPDMALLNLELFMTTAVRRARGTFYALLAENRDIIRVLISLFSTSQFLSRIFIQHPEILDSLVSRSYAMAYKDRTTMEKDLADLLVEADNYEEKLDVLRRFRNEEFLRIAMGDTHGHTPQGELTSQLSYLADACLKQAVTIARDELIPRFGLPFRRDTDQEAGFAIVAMGKQGGMELNYHSDLDIIFVYEGEGETRPVAGTEPDRFKLQSNPEYFSRLAQRIISVLTLMTREGFVYQIDTRLRPSGNQGPLVTSLAAYERYHESAAALWERQALTKARVVLGPEHLSRRIEELNRQFVYEKPVPEGLKEEVYRLRARMETEIAKEHEGHFNIKTGRGGMVDVEFIVQYLQILHGLNHPGLRSNNTLQALDALHQENLLDKKDLDALESGYKFLRRLENRLRLVHDQSINELSGEPGYLVKLARRLGYPDSPRRPEVVFLEEYRSVTEKIRTIFERLLGPEGREG